jgi:hypothetical protein
MCHLSRCKGANEQKNLNTSLQDTFQDGYPSLIRIRTCKTPFTMLTPLLLSNNCELTTRKLSAPLDILAHCSQAFNRIKLFLDDLIHITPQRERKHRSRNWHLTRLIWKLQTNLLMQVTWLHLEIHPNSDLGFQSKPSLTHLR